MRGNQSSFYDKDHPLALNLISSMDYAHRGARGLSMLPCILRCEALFAHHAHPPGRFHPEDLAHLIDRVDIRNKWRFHLPTFLAQCLSLHRFDHLAEPSHG